MPAASSAVDQVLIGAIIVEVCIALLAAVFGGMHTTKKQTRRSIMEPTRTCEYVPFDMDYNAPKADQRDSNREALGKGVRGADCIFTGKAPDTFRLMPEARQIPMGLHYSSHEAYANGAYNVFLRNASEHTVGFLRIRPC